MVKILITKDFNIAVGVKDTLCKGLHATLTAYNLLCVVDLGLCH